jgi:hypothetical protein
MRLFTGSSFPLIPPGAEHHIQRDQNTINTKANLEHTGTDQVCNTSPDKSAPDTGKCKYGSDGKIDIVPAVMTE